jgi:hypothetical protein
MHPDLGLIVGIVALLGGLLQLAKLILEIYGLRRRERRSRMDSDEQ